jgi:single-strand DNA-binding protein
MMNSFTMTAVGNLARNPEAVARGDVTYTRFLLVGNDYAGKDEKGASREIVTSLWFVAFGPLGEALVHHARKGDQLIIEAQVRANTWTDKQGEKQYDHDFIVQGFRFGAPGKAKREELSGKFDPAGKSDEEPKLNVEPKIGTDAKASTETKARDAKHASEGEVDVGRSVNANGKASSSTGTEKQSAQRTGRRTSAPPS